jgi:ribosomal protein S6--L-glutamate ligase
MRIGILSFKPLPKRFSSQEDRLADEAEKRGYKVSIIRVQKCILTLDGKGELNVKIGQKAFPKFDVLIPRVGVGENVQVRSAILEQLQLMGYPMINSYSAILRAKSKLHTLQALSHYKIPVVKTAMVHDIKLLDKALKYIGTFPVVMKTVFGSFGNGVTIVESQRAAKSTYGIISEKFSSKNGILLQEYIGESMGKDIRIFVVGGKMVAAMERVAHDEDFRSNVGQGGKGKPYVPNKEEIHLAVRATKAIGLDIAGVDIIQTKNGPAIMEVNSNPGFKELEEISGVNVAEAIIKYSRRFVQEFVPPSDLI